MKTKMSLKQKREIARLKKAEVLIARAVRLLDRCPNATAMHTELFHAADQCNEDVANIKCGNEES